MLLASELLFYSMYLITIGISLITLLVVSITAYHYICKPSERTIDLSDISIPPEKPKIILENDIEDLKLRIDRAELLVKSVLTSNASTVKKRLEPFGRLVISEGNSSNESMKKNNNTPVLTNDEQILASNPN